LLGPPLQIHAPLRNERVKPDAKLTHVLIPVRPVAPTNGKASLMEPMTTQRGKGQNILCAGQPLESP